MSTLESTSEEVPATETLIDGDAAETEESLPGYTEKDLTSSSILESSAPSPGVQGTNGTCCRSCSLLMRS